MINEKLTEEQIEEMRKFRDIVRDNLAVYQQKAPKEIVRIWWTAISCYSYENIVEAFRRYIKTNPERAPRPGDISKIIEAASPDGRPGVEEAWAMIPRDENKTIVWTEEMAQAFGICKPLLDEGDAIAARMTFKEFYLGIVTKNRAEGIKPVWFASLGQDPNGREHVLNEAIRKGQLSHEQKNKLLPYNTRPDGALPKLLGNVLKFQSQEEKDKAMSELKKSKAILRGMPGP